MSSRDDLAFAVDLGTTGLKVGIAQLDGALVASRQATLSTDWSEGGATQDANEWWRLIGALAHDVLREVDASRVVSVAITGQYGSVVAVDEFGVALAPCVMWMDDRGSRAVRARLGGRAMGYAPRAALTMVRRSGGAPSLNGTDGAGGLLYLWHDKSDLVDRAVWLLEPVDYLVMRFCAKASTTASTMLSWWLTDNRHPERHVYDEKLLALLGVDAEKFAPLIAFGSIAGEVSMRAHLATGLPEGIPVLAGMTDLHAAALGAGTTTVGGPAHLALSSTSWISAPVTKKKTDVRHAIATTPGLDESSYLIVNSQDAGAKAFEWSARALGGAATDLDELLVEAASAAPGSGQVIFSPWLLGERSPVDRHDARAGFHHLSLQTTRAELLRATLEGVAFNSRWLLHYVEKFAGGAFSSLRLLGGGANSNLWCQIMADVTRCSVDQLSNPSLSQLQGCALAAGRTLGVVTSNEIPSLTRVAQRFEPRDYLQSRYDTLYEEFSRLMASQSGMFRRLRDASSSSDDVF
ncbi:MAG TPA: FGGY-family carbohydrate kinase [Acidimicrobiales bacterium]|nr:MAG: hypothetical protein B7X07_00665 [Actinobacteria bacterium 21-64-8]HQT99200.1 FGGY-family carbohydrate kinase [Acidimicrobiales bacterium]